MDCKLEIIWEEIYNNGDEPHEMHFEATLRARVFGGWLVRHITCYRSDEDELGDTELEGWKKREVSMVFISDPNNRWHHPMKGAI